MTNRFTGFKPEALAFLRDLAANNEVSWFKPRKEIYESEVKAPMARFLAALAESLGEHGVPLTGDPLRSIFRIYRDVCFSLRRSNTLLILHSGQVAFEVTKRPPAFAIGPKSCLQSRSSRNRSVGLLRGIPCE
jgi:uncharacterized protein (DUF2461 family)